MGQERPLAEGTFADLSTLIRGRQRARKYRVEVFDPNTKRTEVFEGAVNTTKNGCLGAYVIHQELKALKQATDSQIEELRAQGESTYTLSQAQNLKTQFTKTCVEESIANQVLHQTTALVAHQRIISESNREVKFAKIALPKAARESTAKVCVKTLTGKSVTLFVDLNNETVYELKEKMQQKEGIPPDQQRLVLAGQQLEDDSYLDEYGMQPDSILHMVARLRGSGGFKYKLVAYDVTSQLTEEFEREEDAKFLSRDIADFTQEFASSLGLNYEHVRFISIGGVDVTRVPKTEKRKLSELGAKYLRDRSGNFDLQVAYGVLRPLTEVLASFSSSGVASDSFLQVLDVNSVQMLRQVQTSAALRQEGQSRLSDEALLTLAALKTLIEHYSDSHALWKLVAHRAKKYLIQNTNLSQATIENLVNQVVTKYHQFI